MDEARTDGIGWKGAKKPVLTIGFTLVELLVVIGIIALIAAITLPIISYARESGRRTACQSNLRQIGIAMQQYVQDFDGAYPQEMFAYKTQGVTTEVSWQGVLFPYTKSREIIRCPSQGKAVPTVGIPADGYTLNANRLSTVRWSGTTPPTVIVESTHESEHTNSSTIWMCGDRVAIEKSHCVDCTRGTGSCNRNFYGSTVHGKGGNYSFLDGHVKWYTPDAMAEVDCKNDPVIPLPNNR